MAETKKAVPAIPEKAVPPTDAEKMSKVEAEAKKASEESAKIDAEAQAKVARINTNLAKDGSSRRIMAGPRLGKAKYFWANIVPTQELTDDELKAVEDM